MAKRKAAPKRASSSSNSGSSSNVNKKPKIDESEAEAQTPSDGGLIFEERRVEVHHWYPEPYVLRRFVHLMPTTPTVQALMQRSASEGDSAQVSLLRGLFTGGLLRADAWDKLGYISAKDDKPSLQRESSPADVGAVDKDPHGIPLGHAAYPLVGLCQGRWFLLCSWMNKCREHHTELFNTEAHDIKRRACDVPGRVSLSIPWEALIHAEAARRFSAEITPVCNDVPGIDEFVVPDDATPTDAAGKTVGSAFPGYSQLRNIWHAPAGSCTRGLCSLIPTSKLSGEIGGKIYAVEVECEKCKVWTPQKALVEIPITDMPPASAASAAMGTAHSRVDLSANYKGAESKIGEFHSLLPEFVSPPKGRACKVDRIVVVPDGSNYTSSVYQIWPTVETIRASGYAPLDQFTVVRIVHGRVLRVVFRKGRFPLNQKDLISIETKIAINPAAGTVALDCQELAGASVVVECYSPIASLTRAANQYIHVVVKKVKETSIDECATNEGNDCERDKEEKEDKREEDEDEDEEIVPTLKYASSHYCRCDFTLAAGCGKATVTLLPRKR